MCNDICLQCEKRPKGNGYTLCSAKCAKAAANDAPRLLEVPRDHVMYHDVARRFNEGWLRGSVPSIKKVYLVTWTNRSREEFDRYRSRIEHHGRFASEGKPRGNERKRFRGTQRACTIGKNGNTTMCHNRECKLCKALRSGFGSHLNLKRTTQFGIRLGAGLNSTQDSSKASRYAVNTHYSDVRVMMLCRVVLGESFVTNEEQPTFYDPPAGYDSVYGRPGANSAFSTDEWVVNDERAIRPAYLIVY